MLNMHDMLHCNPFSFVSVKEDVIKYMFDNLYRSDWGMHDIMLLLLPLLLLQPLIIMMQ